MAYFQITANNIKYIVLADDEISALNRFSKNNPAIDPSIKDLDTEDFSLLNNLYINTYIIRNALGKKIFVSASTELEAIGFYNTAFSPIEIKSCRKAPPNYNFLLVNAATATSKVFAIRHAYSPSSADYTDATMNQDIADMLYMGANVSRTGFTYLFGNDLMEENGTKASKWLDKLIAANLRMMRVISASWSYATPATTTANFTANKDSSGYTKAQYDTLVSRGYTKGRNDMLNLGSKADFIHSIHYGSEQDVIDSRTELKSGSGTGVPPAPIFDDVSGTYIWTSSYNSTGGLIYPMNYFGTLLYGSIGFIKGVWSVKPDMPIIINFSSTHYGLITRWLTDLRDIGGIDVANKITVGADVYSDVENASDATGSYVKKVNGKPASVPMSMTLIDRLQFYFKDKGLCKDILITETGYNTVKASLWPSQDLFFKNTTLPYFKDPRCGGVTLFEARNEPLTRANDPDPAERTYGLTQASKDMWRQAILGLPPA